MSRLRLHSRLLLTVVLVVPLAACPNSCVESSPAIKGEEFAAASGAAPAAQANDGAPGALEIVEIAPGESHTVVLTADGSAWTCGNGGDGQLGREYTEECFEGLRVEGLPAIRDVAAGTGYTVFLAENGRLWGAGYGFDERLGPTADARFTQPVELGIEGLQDVAAYTNFTLGRRADDMVVAFGVNDAGGLGHGSSADSATPVETGVEAVAIDAGGGYSLALTAEGQVKSWGMNNYGTLGNPDVASMSMGGSASGGAKGYFSLTPVDVIDRVVAISAGTEHALVARDDGTVWGWGRNINGSLAQPGNNKLFPGPVQIEGLSDIVAVAAGGQFSLALDRSGKVFSWGPNTHGQLGRAIDGPFTTEPRPIGGLPPIERIVAGKDRGYAIDRNRQAWAWGSNQFGELLADAEGLGPPVPVVLGPSGSP